MPGPLAQRRLPPLLLLLLLHGPAASLAGDSCCKKHVLPFVPDPHATPPDTDAAGAPRRIVDPNSVMPESWNEEDDGPWEPDEIDNPAFSWRPPLIPNADFRPPDYLDSLRIELQKAVPWVLMGVLVTATLDVAKVWSERALAARLQHSGPVAGAVMGLATPLCACGSSLPVASGFASAGVPLPTVVAFLTATQSAGIDSAAITWGLLGPQAALFRLGGAVFLSVAAGLAVPASHVRKPAPAKPARPAAKARRGRSPSPAPAPVGQPLKKGQTTFWESAVSTAADVFPPVLVGLCLSTAAVHVAPRMGSLYQVLQASGAVEVAGGEAAAGMALLGSVLVRLAVLGASLPLQLCEYTTVTYAAAIQKAGGPPGLAFAFLLVAPATNVGSMLLLLQTSNAGKDEAAAATTAFRVALALTAAALVVSFAIDSLGVDLLVEREAEHGGVNLMALPASYQTVSPWIAGGLALAALQKRCVQADGCCSDGQTVSGGAKPEPSKQK